MELEETSLKNMYQILVKVTHDHSTTEWHGTLALFPQESGEIFIDISFSDQPAMQARDQPWDHRMFGLSVECLAHEKQCELIQKEDPGGYKAMPSYRATNIPD